VLAIVVHEKGGKTQRVTFTGDRFGVGRESDNDLVLDQANVSGHHMRLRRVDGIIEVLDLESTNGTYVNGRRLRQPRHLRKSDRVYIGDYIIMLDGDDDAIAPREHAELQRDGDGGLVSVGVPPMGAEHGQPLPGSEAIDTDAVMTSARRVAAPGVESEYLDKVANRILQTVLVNIRRLDPIVSADISEDDEAEALELVNALILDMQRSGELEEGVDADALKAKISRELLDLGPLAELMKEDEVAEIQVVGGAAIRVVRASGDSEGRVSVVERRFSGDRALRLVIQRLARRWGFLVEGAQVLEGKVSDGFFMYALLPPNPVQVPVLSLRRTRTDANNLQALVQEGALSGELRELLSAAVRGNRRILLCASGGVNLDRFMGALVGEIPDERRVICISDTGRLGSSRKGWIRVRRMADPADGVSLSDSLGLLLRGGVDLVVSQRTRHEDAAAVIDALSGATSGAIVSLWGIDSSHSLSRLAALSTVASGAIGALTIALARSVDLLVRLSIGVNNEPMQVIEVIEPRVKEGNQLQHVPIFKAVRAEDGTTKFEPTGTVPHFVERLAKRGVSVPKTIFEK